MASVPALPGCHTQGETLEEAERNVKEAVALYLESLAAPGTITFQRPVSLTPSPLESAPVSQTFASICVSAQFSSHEKPSTENLITRARRAFM